LTIGQVIGKGIQQEQHVTLKANFY